ncbi:hypothetical protein ACHAPX_000315 [Trichoderma viride]
MFGILEAVAVPHAGVFSTYEELIKDLNGRMEKEGYKIVKARSHRSRMGGADIPGNDIVRCDLVCDRGGRPYKCMATKHKTTTKKTDCPWKAKAVNRKSIGGWVLTISCDQHNHAPGTPEPPTPSEMSEEENDLTELADMDDGPRPDAQTATAIQLAGVSESTLRLTGDTFHQLKSDYRKMPQPDRLNALAQMRTGNVSGDRKLKTSGTCRWKKAADNYQPRDNVHVARDDKTINRSSINISKVLISKRFITNSSRKHKTVISSH